MVEIRDIVKTKIREVATEISALAVREYVGEAEDYIAELEVLIERILAIPELKA